MFKIVYIHMNFNRQDIIKKHFERLSQSGITPWTNHPPEPALSRFLEFLKKKSFVYLAVFSLKNPEGIGQRFTKKQIEDLFGAHFEIVSFDQDPYPTPAPAHLLHFVLK